LHDRSLGTYVCHEMIQQGSMPSKKTLTTLLPTLLSAFAGSRIVIDGLDELPGPEVKDVLATLSSLVTGSSTSSDGKLMVFSRNIISIRNGLRKATGVNLSNERDAVDQSISSYVRHELQLLRLDLPCDRVSEQMYEDTEQKMSFRADGKHGSRFQGWNFAYTSSGMFLWARLMITTLRDVASIWELERAVDSLPSGLNEAYCSYDCSASRANHEQVRHASEETPGRSEGARADCLGCISQSST
jgi:hypothetical protein